MKIIQLLNQEKSKEHKTIVNVSDKVVWKIKIDELKYLINKPIFRNEFQITIPIKSVKIIENSLIQKELKQKMGKKRRQNKRKEQKYTIQYDNLKKY